MNSYSYKNVLWKIIFKKQKRIDSLFSLISRINDQISEGRIDLVVSLHRHVLSAQQTQAFSILYSHRFFVKTQSPQTTKIRPSKSILLQIFSCTARVQTTSPPHVPMSLLWLQWNQQSQVFSQQTGGTAKRSEKVSPHLRIMLKLGKDWEFVRDKKI